MYMIEEAENNLRNSNYIKIIDEIMNQQKDNSDRLSSVIQSQLNDWIKGKNQ